MRQMKVIALGYFLVIGGVSQTFAAPVDFNRDIRPILSEHCFACHGPDAETREADLRLDTHEGALADLGGYNSIVAGDAEASELYQLIIAGKDDRMPPAKSGDALSAKQIALLKQWINEGAAWGDHWSFVVPTKPAAPKTKAKWGVNPIDDFILANLESQDLAPSAWVGRARIIRRLSLDLRGLPPTLEEIDAFLADKKPGAYNRLVDRFLASKHFGERMTLEWLDAARYADTNGFSIDDERTMWKWRDWVINAYNKNMPFDQFTIEQLAGDLLPNPTLDQKIASGFNRNNMNTHEGGTIPEEYLTIYNIDRVRTTASVWMGLTMHCAQCHDHKYDPITMKDFYQFFAYFNTISDKGNDGNRGVNSIPFIDVATDKQLAHKAALNKKITAITAQIKKPSPAFAKARDAWIESLATANSKLAPLNAQVITFNKAKSLHGATLTHQKDGSYLVSGKRIPTDQYTLTFKADTNKPITGFQIEGVPHKSLNGGGPGRSHTGDFNLNEIHVFVNGQEQNFRAATQTPNRGANQNALASFDGKMTTGWRANPDIGEHHQAQFILAKPIANNANITIQLDFLTGSELAFGSFRISSLQGGDIKSALAADIIKLATIAKRTPAQTTKLNNFYNSISPTLRELNAQLESLRASITDLNIPTTMIMAEAAKPRKTHILTRGEYDKPGEEVFPNTPAFMPPLPTDAPTNRLTMAKWLVDGKHPLTARVTVNRYWQMLFGTGLVKTSEDFGSQGEWPSHPELLDYLAVKFVNSGWDVKAIIKHMVTSAAYRQNSNSSPALNEQDPNNRLLARGPRFRLPAELVRDQALALSGLLANQTGGASAKPYQPAGLWVEVSHYPQLTSAQKFDADTGAGLYRKSMYTFWKRTVPPPTMATFDAPNREVCTVRRERTNTPLQALVLLNDVQFVEAARAVAQRVLQHKTNNQHARLRYAVRLITGRVASTDELAVLTDLLAKQKARYKADPSAASALINLGESKRDTKIPATEHAAWTTITSILMNLSETITKS